MPQFLRTKIINREDPPEEIDDTPDYFKPKEQIDDGITPDYFKPVEEIKTEKPKSKSSFFGSLKNAVKTTKDELDRFVTDTVSKKPEDRSAIQRLLISQHPGAESILPTMRQPDTYAGGFRKGLYDEFIRPLGSMEGAAGLITGGESVPKTSGRAARAAASELPIRRPVSRVNQSTEIPHRMGSSVQDAAAPIENIKIPEKTIVKAADKPKPKVEAESIKPKPKFVNPFEKAKTEVVDEADRAVAPKQEEIPSRLPVKAEGTEFQAPPARRSGDHPPIKRDILRDYTGEKFKPEVYDNARDIFNMGRDLPQTTPDTVKPTAKFAYHQPDFEGGSIPIYNVEGGPLNRSSVAADTLKKNGIDVPETPKFDPQAKPVKPADIPAEPKLVEGWKAPDYAQMSDDATKLVNPSADDVKIPELIDELPDNLKGIKSPHLLTEKPVTSSVDDTMEALNRLEKENPNASKLSEQEYDDLHAKYLNDIKKEKTLSEHPLNKTDDKPTELQGGLGGVKPSKRILEPSTGPYGAALDKMFKSMGTISEKRLEQDIINKIERARRFAAAETIDEVGAKGAAMKLSAMKGVFDKVDLEKLQMTKPQVDSLFTAVDRANITTGEKMRSRTALFKILNGDEIPQRNELALLDEVFGNDFASKITELHGGIGAVGLNIAKTANTMKSMMSSVDVSAPLRQGSGLITRKEFGPAFVDMFKFMKNKDYYNSAMQALEERPDYLLGRESGLFIAKPGTLLNAEEAFLNSYVGQIPGVRNIVSASDRAYTGFLNKLRSDTFDNMIRRAKELGINVGDEKDASKEARAIAKFINTATGRGDLGKLNKISNELNAVLWSPKLIASRVQMLTNPKIYTDLPKGMRMEGLRSLLGIAAMGLTTSGLAAAGGGKIGTNILSSDFGKSRFGDKVLDPWAGYQQYIVAAARFLSGKTDSKTPTSRMKIAGRFLANKESPAASLAHELLTAKAFTGDPDNPKTAGNFTNEYGEKTSVQRETTERFIPMFIQTLEELAAADPKWSEEIGLTAALVGASALGMGVQAYPEKKKSVFGKMKVR